MNNLERGLDGQVLGLSERLYSSILYQSIVFYEHFSATALQTVVATAVDLITTAAVVTIIIIVAAVRVRSIDR